MTVRTAPPPVHPADDWRFPAAEESRIPNGIRVLAYHCPGQHVVAASLLFDVPLEIEPRDKEGVAALTARCLVRGAGTRTAEEFADALALCGADLDAAAFSDGFAVRLSTPVTSLGAALDLLADAVVRPALDDGEFEHEKALHLQEIDQARAYPQHVAGEQLNAALFGTSRSARPGGGVPATVEVIERADVVAFAGDHLQPRTATMIAAGDFSTVDVTTEIERALGGWSHQGLPPADKVPIDVSQTAQVILVDWPDAPQSTLRVAGPGITRADEAWQALFVANYAVGGNFSSRINTVLREQKG